MASAAYYIKFSVFFTFAHISCMFVITVGIVVDVGFEHLRYHSAAFYVYFALGLGLVGVGAAPRHQNSLKITTILTPRGYNLLLPQPYQNYLYAPHIPKNSTSTDFAPTSTAGNASWQN
jgi:hypothetical protein